MQTQYVQRLPSFLFALLVAESPLLILFFQLFLLLAWCVQVIIINIGSILPLDGSKETDVGEIFFIYFFFTRGICVLHCAVHYVRHFEFPNVTVLG